MMHMDKLLLVVYNGFLAAAAERERELITVFRSYDKDGDGQLSLEEFQRIVEDIDAGVSPALQSCRPRRSFLLSIVADCSLCLFKPLSPHSGCTTSKCIGGHCCATIAGLARVTQVLLTLGASSN